MRAAWSRTRLKSVERQAVGADEGLLMDRHSAIGLTHLYPGCAPCPSVVMMGFRSWPFLRFLPPFPLAACATAFALLMAAFLISAPFIVAFPATRWPWLGGGVGRCGVRSRPVRAQATPHRRAVQEKGFACRGNTYICRDRPAVAPSAISSIAGRSA